MCTFLLFESPLASLSTVLAQEETDAPTLVRSPVSDYVGPIRGSAQLGEFFSQALDRDMPYFIYLPPGYEKSDRRYPALYMLHGNSGSYEEWGAYGLIDEADSMIESGDIQPLIIVLPQGDYSYWVNLPGGGPNYADYLDLDLIQHIDSSYRTLPDARHRAIGGLSMGATGALINAFHHPDIYAVVGSHSASLPAEGERPFLGSGEEFAARDPIELAESEQLGELAIWIDVGDEDPWLDRTEELHEILDGRSIGHEWHVFPGEHWGGYWSENTPSYLRFYNKALNSESGR